MIRIRQGLDVPILGHPEQTIEPGVEPRHVALLGDDYAGMKPTMAVQEGDSVALGQLLFEDKKTAGVRFTSPGAGTVVAVNRGAKRKFESIVIRLGGDAEETFAASDDIGSLSREAVRDNLVASGLWTAIRTRPFGKVPEIDAVPHSIFVQAIDTLPLAADPAVALRGREADFEAGLRALSQLTEGTVFVCTRPGMAVPAGGDGRLRHEEFAGPHPAGLSGTHIHKLDPVSEKKTVWSIGYQDVAAIGNLFTTGRLSVERVIALAGPVVKHPRLIQTRLGAAIEDLVAGESDGGDIRWISGSVLDGRTAEGSHAYLGRNHLQVSGVAVETKRAFLGWMGPGLGSYSATRVFATGLMPGKRFPFNTNTNGSSRAIIPIGAFEKVVPLDLLPTPLLKSIMVGDAERSQELGCLELTEEDLALCSFVDPGKSHFGPALRQVLDAIEREG